MKRQIICPHCEHGMTVDVLGVEGWPRLRVCGIGEQLPASVAQGKISRAQKQRGFGHRREHGQGAGMGPQVFAEGLPDVRKHVASMRAYRPGKRRSLEGWRD